jgi:predicted nucleic acid-binding protein
MMMAARVFVDTNILLRVVLSEMSQHAQADALLKRVISEGAELWISGQVIREFVVQATHPRTLNVPLTIRQAVYEVLAFDGLFHIADETSAVRSQLLELLLEYPTLGKQVHDANLVATMLVYGIDTLLTMNVADLKRFADKITLLSPLDISN